MMQLHTKNDAIAYFFRCNCIFPNIIRWKMMQLHTFFDAIAFTCNF
nr:MAG TPA: hypothetical protein [Caudoviricetes sp.]